MMARSSAWYLARSRGTRLVGPVLARPVGVCSAIVVIYIHVVASGPRTRIGSGGTACTLFHISRGESTASRQGRASHVQAPQGAVAGMPGGTEHASHHSPRRQGVSGTEHGRRSRSCWAFNPLPLT